MSSANISLTTTATTETLKKLNQVIEDVRCLWAERSDRLKKSISDKSKESEALELLDRTNDGSFIVYLEYDDNGNPILPPHEVLSDKFFSELGYAKEEVKLSGWEFWRWKIDQSDLCHMDGLFQDHLTQGTELKCIVNYEHKDGHMIKFLCRGDNIKDKQGRPIVVYGTHTNLTKLGDT